MKVKGRILIFMLCLTALFMFAACGQGGSGLQSMNDDSAVSTMGKNNPPIADAGRDSVASIGSEVSLDGSGSYDPEGMPLTYFWEFASVPAGSTAALNTPTEITASFVPDIEGQYEISLTVKDDKKTSDPDNVVINAIITIPAPPNLIPDVLPDTGQIIRGDLYGNPFGVDADYTINPPSYQDNGDGTVTDLVTNLVWQQGGSSATLPSAISICDSLSLGGQDDWRLPSKKELMSLYSFNATNERMAFNADYFTVSTTDYLTSTYSASSPVGEASYWVIGWMGDIGYLDINTTGGVRCVRGDGYQTEKSFVDNGDGTVTDLGLGLMWQQEEIDLRYERLEDVLAYCEGLSMAGHDDWRLPNIKELESLTVDTLYGPAADTGVFPGISNPLPSNTYFISSTVWTNIPSYLFSMDFFYGYAMPTARGEYVRCVR